MQRCSLPQGTYHVLCGISIRAALDQYSIDRTGKFWGGEKHVNGVNEFPTEAFDADSFIADCIRIEQENLDLPAIELLADSRTSAIKT
jgi:hypothetical protein